MLHTTLRRGFAAAGAAILLSSVGIAPAAAQADAPPGNNGTIKIDDVLIDDGNENVPHPGCTFVVDFFGYDVGDRAAVMTFEGQDPTGGGELLVEQAAFTVESRESGNQLNHSQTIDLSSALIGIEPHPKQGWHVKLTVNVTGSQGADAKHKVFWVSECTEPALIAAQTASDERAAAAEAAVLAENEAAWYAAQAAAEQEAAALDASATSAAPVDELPRTGVMTDVLAGLAIALVAAGGMLVLMSARSSRRALLVR